ncbi:MAG: 50S ribosomal protein L4 [Flavobacteriales bacterium AspAUS03]
MEVVIFDIKGKETGRHLILDKNIFGVTPHDHAVYLEIKRYLAAQRQGTHKAKERSELSGSTRKLQRQKGTGNARKGDINNPLFKGGARVFGPQPRDYQFKLNKSLKRLAKRSILSKKLKDNQLKIVEDFSLDIPKTKSLLEIVKSLSITDKKTLIILEKPNKNLYLSSRNLQRLKIVTNDQLSSYELLDASYLVFLESAIEKVQKKLKN